ncbi:uncharacterized protein LOC103354757 [Stegastes partitus]|uniref:Uncharacterized protein LOC103354757 n=1 Tax=Stegastes partitus TaxID=144197 RepID=A0A9Y4JL77_9TELE|nr:PREDICTED: uncharacterized protein LOC103354757 [Stegastes partitus]
MFRVNMKKLICAVSGRKKPQRSDSKRRLMEKNNNNSVQGGYADILVQNAFNTEEERPLRQEKDGSLQELFELLGEDSDTNTNTSGDGACCSGQHNLQQRVVHIIRRHLSQRFPKPPADLDQNLWVHLRTVKEVVFDQFPMLSPLLESRGMMGCVVDCYHRHTFDHLHGLIQNVSSSNNSFVLMDWFVHTYLSHEALGRPDQQLLGQWAVKAKTKLLEHVQKEIRGILSGILQNERGQQRCDSVEAYVWLYVDTIQCVAAKPTTARTISSELHDQVQEVCFRELLTFVLRYTAEKKEFLGNKAEMDPPETIHFLKTLKTCKELRQYVEAEGRGVESSLLDQIVATLKDMEDFTLKLLMEIIVDIAESHLKKYFRSDSRRCYLFAALENLFPKLSYVSDELKRVVDQAYKLVAHLYLKHLIQTNRRKLKQRWSPNVEQTVQEDAKQLHRTMSNLAPGVQQWNLMLLDIPEVLECKCMEALKMTVAQIEKKCNKQSEDLALLPALLRWKGLSKRQVREVMEALPSGRPVAGSGSWFFCLPCW